MPTSPRAAVPREYRRNRRLSAAYRRGIWRASRGHPRRSADWLAWHVEQDRLAPTRAEPADFEAVARAELRGYDDTIAAVAGVLS